MPTQPSHRQVDEIDRRKMMQLPRESATPSVAVMTNATTTVVPDQASSFTVSVTGATGANGGVDK